MNTLESFFQWLLAAGLHASILAGAVVCLQFALRRWLPARWRFALWLPVVIVLVAPVLPESRFSIQNRFVAPAPAMVAARNLLCR
jgi:beta-lactamase regulating signal transducer with metallopeptidase domain